MPTRALRTAAAGMAAQQINIQVIANNIANINTTSFKKNRAEFQDMMYQEVQTNLPSTEIPGIVENPGSTIQVGNGVKLSSTAKDFTQGDMRQTGLQLDLAVQGEGFFQLRQLNGEFAYTRDGSFKLSGDGTIVNAQGYVLEPGFTFPDDTLSVEITQDGILSITQTGGDKVEIGTVELAKFINPSGLKAIGDNMYTETEESGVPVIGAPSSEGFGAVNQGYLEASNVDIVDEMISMITAQRAYEINSKTVKTVEELMTIANNIKR